MMASSPSLHWQTISLFHGETMKTVRDFIFGGCKITGDGDCSKKLEHQRSCCLFHNQQASSTTMFGWPGWRGSHDQNHAALLWSRPASRCPGSAFWHPWSWHLGLNCHRRTRCLLDFVEEGKEQQPWKHDLCLLFISKFHKSTLEWPNLTHTWNLHCKESEDVQDTPEILENQSFISSRPSG